MAGVSTRAPADHIPQLPLPSKIIPRLEAEEVNQGETRVQFVCLTSAAIEDDDGDRVSFTDNPLKLADLFDLRSKWWDEYRRKLQLTRTLEDEMTLYELLDLDAEGDEELDE